MKAVFLTAFGGAENFELREMPAPSLVNGGVRVQIKATAFNPIDYQMRRGGNENTLLKSSVLGREMAGIITEKDSTVKNLQVGDEVFGYVGSLGSSGTYAEEIVVPNALVAKKPANLSFEQAAAIPLVGLTALQALSRSQFEPKSKIFVTGGSGGVGSMLIRLLKLNGAKSIFSTAGNEESRKQLISLGLTNDRIFDYRDAGFVDKLSMALAGKADICFDTVGGRMSEISAEIINTRGVYADITFMTTETARKVLFGKAVTVLNISNYAYTLDGVSERLKFYSENLSFLRHILESGELKATPIKVVGGLSVESVARAHDLLEKNLTRGKKLVMEIN